jgi:hypothetical protein
MFSYTVWQQEEKKGSDGNSQGSRWCREGMLTQEEQEAALNASEP